MTVERVQDFADIVWMVNRKHQCEEEGLPDAAAACALPPAIYSGRERFAPSANPYRSSHIHQFMPPVFEAYAKIFHCFWVDDSVDDPELTWHEAASATRRNRQPRQERGENDPFTADDVLGLITNDSVLVRSWPDNDAELRRVLWRDLAHQYDVPWHFDLDLADIAACFPHTSFPRIYAGPAEGALEDWEQDRLIELISRQGLSGAAYYYFWFVASGDFDDMDDEIGGKAYAASLGEFQEVMELSGANVPPQYVWARDQSWCVHTDYDLCFTLVGGTRGLVDALVNDDILECLEVVPIAYKS